MRWHLSDLMGWNTVTSNDTFASVPQFRPDSDDERECVNGFIYDRLDSRFEPSLVIEQIIKHKVSVFAVFNHVYRC